MDSTFEAPLMTSDYSAIRFNLFERFPHSEIRGIDIGRVERFIIGEGLEVRPYIVFNKEDLSEVKKIVGNTRLLKNAFSDEGMGFYSPEMDLVLLMRDRGLEYLNGSLCTEGLLVHELAHGSSGFKRYNSKADSYSRVGFGLPHSNRGWFLEQGFAEVLRGHYITNYITKEQLEDLWFNLFSQHQYHTRLPELEDTVPLEDQVHDYHVPVPLKYWFRKKYVPTIALGTPVAFGIELLCRKNPALWQLMKEARSTATGLANLAKAINQISPGLYPYLQKLDDTTEAYVDGVNHIANVLYGGLRNVIEARGELSELWKSKGII